MHVLLFVEWNLIRHLKKANACMYLQAFRYLLMQ